MRLVFGFPAARRRSAPVILAGFLLLWAAAAAAGEKPASQVIVEGGLVVPYGDLDDAFQQTRLGFGAGNGFEVGFRYRAHLSRTFSVAPSFHFVDYKDFSGADAVAGDYRIQASGLRFAVEFMVMSEFRSPGRPRPFLAAGVGLGRNRVQGYYQDFDTLLDESLNSLAASFRGGLQIYGFEFSLVYNLNRFNTWQFYRSDYRERYNWDNLGLRLGWVIPLK